VKPGEQMIKYHGTHGLPPAPLVATFRNTRESSRGDICHLDALQGKSWTPNPRSEECVGVLAAASPLRLHPASDGEEFLKSCLTELLRVFSPSDGSDGARVLAHGHLETKRLSSTFVGYPADSSVTTAWSRSVAAFGASALAGKHQKATVVA
jgi:hypothetical protein